MRGRLVAACAVLVLASAATPAADARKPGPLVLRFPASVLLTGRTLNPNGSHHVTGHVFLTARWNGGPRYTVAAPKTDAEGRWAVRFRPSHRGRYTVRVVLPDGGVLDYAFLLR